MKKKILFIMMLNDNFEYLKNPQFNEVKSTDTGVFVRKVSYVVPLGLLSIATYVQEKIQDVAFEVIDFNVCYNDLFESGDIHQFNDYGKFAEKVLKEKVKSVPEIIGISSLYTIGFTNFLELTNVCRKLFPDAYIVSGGSIATNSPEMVFEKTNSVDALCYGEGEIPFYNLIAADIRKNREEYVALSKPWITKEKLEKGFLPEFEFIVNLDEIHPLDYGLLEDINNYLNSSESVFFYREAQDLREINMMSSRGCPHKCVFCASHKIHGKDFRFYSAERVISDIKILRDKYKIDRVNFMDDHFFLKKGRAKEILTAFKDIDVIAGLAGDAVYSINEETAGLLSQAGVKTFSVALESGSERVLRDIIHKPLKLSMVPKAIDALHNAGIFVAVNIMIGLPGETKDDIEETLRFLNRSNINWVLGNVATPLPGSEFYKICVDNGYFVKEGAGSFTSFRRCIIKTPDFTPEYIDEKLYQINLEANFVNNYDYRAGNYAVALMLFEHIITKISTHAFACYYASLCCEKLGNAEKALTYKNMFIASINSDKRWKDYAVQFNLI